MKLRISLLVTVVIIIAGCSSTGATDGPVLTSPAQLFGRSAGMTAEETGVLVFDDSTNCLLMELKGV